MLKRFAVPVFSLAALLLTTFATVAQHEGEITETMSIKVSPYDDRPPENAESIATGKEIYDLSCVFCHGVHGEGKGPVTYFLSRDIGPHPRDLTAGIYKFRSTASGDLPMDEDLFRIITNGVVGFMPPFVGLDTADRWQVIYYIKSLYPGFAESEPEALEIVGSPIPSTAGSISRGHQVYQDFKCWECHGGGGRGDGEKAPDLKDDWGLLIPPRNLTMRGSFKNGNRPEDIYRTIMTGLDGGAMPSYADFFEGDEEDAWHLANYVLSFSSDR